MANAEITLSAHSANNQYIKDLEERVDSLESRNVFQDDVIDQLSEELAVHQHAIAELKQQIQLVANRLKDAGNLSSSQTEEVEPPPPHY
ncbi:SlyX family protein [Colwellia sp. D2M02]|uniref:SlyX family protein n=1 Tax=Colwellia sp. D2M02 TaxID=2841562 RepID=UPI001C097559|nr:SlyX family protein [Colwellia sp. D2M02]MBU2893279.1 SlyX family protein [Colwellia sp. D2M02]